MDLPRIDNSNLLEKTYVILKDRIVRREFAPNQKLSIADLASQLGVSRTPVRDALNRLETAGLVKTVPRVGTFVNSIEVQDLVDSIDTRLMIELWVVEKLAILPKADVNESIEKLEVILDHAAAELKHFSVDAYLKSDYNLQFHIEFIRTGKNRKNVDIYRSIMDYHFLAVEHSLFTKEMVRSALNQHWSIVECMKHGVKDGNFAGLKSAITLHLSDSKDRLTKRLQANGGQI
jgi:DNA-binding GntR family transcriptional regulator